MDNGENLYRQFRTVTSLELECRRGMVFRISESSIFSFPSDNWDPQRLKSHEQRQAHLRDRTGTPVFLYPHCPVGRIWTGRLLKNAYPLNFICPIFSTHKYAQILKTSPLFVRGLQKCVIKTTLPLANSQGVSWNMEIIFSPACLNSVCSCTIHTRFLSSFGEAP